MRCGQGVAKRRDKKQDVRGERKRDRESQDEREKIKMEKRGKQMQNINEGEQKI